MITEKMDSQSKVLASNCEKCGELNYIEIELLGQTKLMPRMCQCARDEYNNRIQQDRDRERQLRLNNLFTNSLMDRDSQDKTFDKWDFNKGSRKMYTLGIRYSERFSEVKKDGIGLLIHGKPGNGKTFLTCCIANKLLENFTPTICISINGLLTQIKNTFNKYGDQAEADILRGICGADLLIIDDLGTENLKDWAVSTIYNIIDSRYRSKLPLIITTNLNIDTKNTGGVLSQRYGRRTEDRIFEMCTPVENDEESVRIQTAKKKTEILRGILYD